MRGILSILLFVFGGMMTAWGFLAFLGWLNAGELWRLLNSGFIPGGIFVSYVAWTIAFNEMVTHE